ncbi:MAG: TraR/DksA family transcriptional regulator [Candidatus Brocadiales bacterium]
MLIQKKVLKELEARLSTRRNRLLKEIHRRLQEYKDSGGSRLPDVIDIASSTIGDELTLQLAESEVQELRQIEDALVRLRSGSYGICKNCGTMIPRNRLKALPFATLCVKCKEEEEEEYRAGAGLAEKPTALREEEPETAEDEEGSKEGSMLSFEELEREFSPN